MHCQAYREEIVLRCLCGETRLACGKGEETAALLVACGSKSRRALAGDP